MICFQSVSFLCLFSNKEDIIKKKKLKINDQKEISEDQRIFKQNI